MGLLVLKNYAIMLKFLKKIIVPVLFLAIGFGAGLASYEQYCQKNTVVHQIRPQNNGSYKFINPLYECEVGGETYLSKYIPFEDKIRTRINDEVQKDGDFQLSVYFRNLQNGPSFGINPDQDFAPASLLKLPLMIAYFKKAEINPELLNDELVFTANENSDGLREMQQIAPAEHLQSGQSYTVDELIRWMIIDSDNDSMALLMEHFSKDDLYQIYGELGIVNPYNSISSDSISVKDYASFLRILYNAAYLSQASSEKALGLLAQSNFKDALVAGVPDSIKVAHKFGEREMAAGEKYSEEFHDCGIVYYEKYPYLLCVMTKGNDKNQLIGAVRDISRITYEEIARSYP